MIKTNAMRRLDAAKIKYEVKEYEVDESDLSGIGIAQKVGLPFEMVFKTLVARGDVSGVIVLCIPVDKEINLKKAASFTGNKRLEMLHVKELLSTTGYIRGGCSPIGMKKKFCTYLDKSAENHDKIAVSAGVRGAMLFLNVNELADFVNAEFCSLCE